jgi:hypothetical protein
MRRPSFVDVSGRGRVMARHFRGKISPDIRDSVPDWDPYLAPKAPNGAPNVLILA